MTTQPPDRLFRPVSPAAQAKGERVFCAAVALLLVLSEVFSSNIQNTLPTFSHVCRIALTVTAAVLLVAKSLLLTQWQTKQQALTAAALAAFAAKQQMAKHSPAKLLILPQFQRRTLQSARAPKTAF